MSVRARWLLLTAVAPLLFAVGCPTGGGGPAKPYVTIGTGPSGGTFAVIGAAVAKTLEKHKGDDYKKFEANGTKGSQESIRRLAEKNIELGMSNSTISYFAYRGEADWDQEYDIRTVVTIAPLVAMFVTKEGTGIRTIADLKDRRVVVGPAGAGFEMFVAPILEEHGLNLSDIDKINAIQSAAVDLLADGSADAVFLGGGVPTPSIVQACSTQDIVFIPFAEDARERLIEKYPSFAPITLKKGTYQDLTEDFAGLNVGSMHIITAADADEAMIYHVTKTLWENRAELTESHGALKFIREDNAARYTGVPFHPGAEKFYKEIGIWNEDSVAPAEEE
jgi:TRAP transporter TAXI family solute receptor